MKKLFFGCLVGFLLAAFTTNAQTLGDDGKPFYLKVNATVIDTPPPTARVSAEASTPTEQISLNSATLDNKVSMKWRRATDQSSRIFLVQRSPNNQTYETVETIVVQNQPNFEFNQSCDDERVREVFYRIVEYKNNEEVKVYQAVKFSLKHKN
jgi:parvulin-like peptidyl-prolyl isomerase